MSFFSLLIGLYIYFWCYLNIKWCKLPKSSQNLHWKLGQLTPSFGSLLGYLMTTVKKKIFRNKTFLFLKIESWDFQHLFEKEFCETSQNFNSFRQLLFSFFLSVVWLTWNFVRFHEILLQRDGESFSFLSWKTKSFIPIKIFSRPLSILNQKSFVHWPNFQWRFWKQQ